MLTLSAVSYAYPGRDAALRDITLAIPSTITLLVGPNAGGKTTLLRLLAGLLEPYSGAVTLNRENAPLAPGDLRRLSRMVMQDADPQILGATVREDVDLGKSASELKADFAAAAAKLGDKLGLLKLWDEPVDTLSYGQKRKLCLMHALLAGPKILLLDEPFAGLDYPAAKELRVFIRENAREGLTQILSTHELEPAFDLAEKLVVIDKGVIAAEGTPEEIAPELHRWSVRAPGKGWE